MVGHQLVISLAY